MGTRFTRVTVVGDARQIDISMPADTPVAEQLPAVLRLLSVPTASIPVPWRLAAPEFGSLEPSRSLDEAGVLDGTVLHLTTAAAAPAPPFVDDVESAVAEIVADRAPAWAGPARRDVVGWLVAALLGALVAVGTAAPPPVRVLVPVLAAMAGLAIGGVVRERGGWACALIAVPASLVLAVGWVSDRPVALRLGGTGAGSALADVAGGLTAAAVVALAGAVALALAGLVRRSPAVALAGAVLAAVGGGVLLCARLALPMDRIAALMLVVAVVLSGLAGQAALGGAGLVDLMVADERGESVPRHAVTASVTRGLGIADGIVRACVATGSVACAVLVMSSPGPDGPAPWIGAATGALGGLLFALRSRMFTRAAHVGAMLVVPLVTVVFLAVRLPSWWQLSASSGAVLTATVLVAAGAVALATGLGGLAEVPGARVQRGLERLELLATLALLPAVVVIFQVIPAVQRRWS